MRWPGGRPPPSEAALEETLRSEGLSPRWWSNGPGDTYGSHAHPYHKILYCAQGSIEFRLDAEDEALDLHAGDRLEIPAGTPHSALVGPEGVSCVEAARR
jgi:mannose-6-phosphate isomerase-like protein (cupin superfamily)